MKSFSQLRGLVGGRFENLKKKWLAAGLPLREHGEPRGGLKIDPDSWRALASWTAKQGFEVRLAAEGAEHLFEARRLRKQG